MGEEGAAVFVPEEVVGRGERRQVPTGVAERDLDGAHVEVRRVIRRDDEVRVPRDVVRPVDLGVERALVEELLREREPALAGARDQARHAQLGVVDAGVRFGRASAPPDEVTAREQLVEVRHRRERRDVDGLRHT